jgi:lipopolysaccharide/colanic/teichoic acid biosynthesis glycosyltransferase
MSCLNCAPQLYAPGLDRRRTRPLVVGEQLFRDVLVRERKRADRFDQPLVVLFVTVARAHGPDPLSTWAAIVQALAVVRRRTDVLGWLEEGAALGLILTDIGPADAAVPSKTVHRVRRELATRLDERSLRGVSVRPYAYSGRHESADCRSSRCSSRGSWCRWCCGPPWARSDAFAPVDPLLERLPRSRRVKLRQAVKRALDIVGSLLLLVLLAPLFALIAALVKSSSPGPVFFRQVRVGQQAKRFEMLKFRSMYANSDHALHKEYVTWFIQSSSQHEREAGEVFKLTHDPRVTRLGQVLRKTSLDELPQLWNVLRGDMSLVGPRPPLPFEVEQYRPWHKRRVLEAKPGITGLWQVNGRSRTTFDEMVRMDLRYARACSLWTDIKILAATPAAVIRGKGAC